MSIIIQDNVVFLSQNKLNEYPKIIDRLKQISQGCNFTFNTCGIYQTCDSYIILAIDKEKLDLKTMIKPEEIIGYLIAIIRENHIEIYNFCIDKTMRNKGIGRKLLEATISKSQKPYIWLGIDFKNPEYERVLKLYTINGFKDPIKIDKTPSGLNIGYPVLGLTYNKNQPNLQDWKKSYNEGLRIKINMDYSVCITHLGFTKKTLTQLQQYLTKDKEYGGSFIKISSFDNVNFLDIDEKNINTGEMSVRIPSSNFTFHSHPQICYLKFGCYLGWPSSQDMVTCFEQYQNFQKQLLHIVVTVEGLYLITLSFPMMILVDLILQYNDFTTFNKIVNSISKNFTFLETYRGSSELSKKIPNISLININNIINDESSDLYKQLFSYVQTYFSYISSFTISSLSSLLSNYPTLLTNLDVPVFNVRLISWKTVNDVNSFIKVSTETPICPSLK